MRSLLRMPSPRLQGWGRALSAQAASGPMTMKGGLREASCCRAQRPREAGFAPQAVATTGSDLAWLPVSSARVQGYGEAATSLVTAESFRFVVDEPPRMGGKGIGERQPDAMPTTHLSCPFCAFLLASLRSRAGPNPLSTLLGSLVGCTQFTASMIAREMKLGSIGSVAWSAAGGGAIAAPG